MPVSVELEEFGKLLIQHVRDPSIRASDRCLSGAGKDRRSQRWREAAAHLSPEEFAKAVIPDVVDMVMLNLLQAIDQNHLALSFTASNGQTFVLAEEDSDPIIGLYAGRENWVGQYAQERYEDDFTDVCNDFVKELIEKLKLKKRE